jgi:hypothetical protein
MAGFGLGALELLQFELGFNRLELQLQRLFVFLVVIFVLADGPPPPAGRWRRRQGSPTLIFLPSRRRTEQGV